MILPGRVRDLCDCFLTLAPEGLVTGLYLTGGLGFGEWVAGQSDIDFLATVAHRPSGEDMEQLRAVHAQMATASTIKFDGMYVLVSDLASDPRELPRVPVVLHSEFNVGRLDPLVAWHELAWHGVRIAGPDLVEVEIWADMRALRAHTSDNLDTYWRRLAGQLADSSADEPESDLDHACCWCVLGVVRLHHLLITGEMTTKSGAARWGLSYYDERWHLVLREALRLREGGKAEYNDQASRLRDMTDFTAHVVAEGTRPTVGRFTAT